jgi:hypothetical protein
MVTEVARAILAEWEVSLDTLLVDVLKAGTFQQEVLARQFKAEKLQESSFVSDRAFDSLAYAAEHTLDLRMLLTPTLKDYIEWVNSGIVFFIRPHLSLLKADGVRATSHLQWDSVVRIDGMIKFILEFYGTEYIQISTPNMQERARTIQYVLDKEFKSR